MKKVKFTYRMQLQFDQPVEQHAFSLLAFPMRQREQQICGFQWRLDPAVSLNFHQDCFGNTVAAGYCDKPHDSFLFEMEGLAWLDWTNPQKKQEAPCMDIYRYPSPNCEMTEPMRQFLRQHGASRRVEPVQRALWMMERLHQNFEYETGSTSVQTTAGQAFDQGRGVCQDYAHIFLALCRADGIPARYVAGIISGEGESHAWTEVYDGRYWHGLDPTHNKQIDNHYLKLAHGRDARDCLLNRGMFQGITAQQQVVRVSLEELAW